MSLLLTRTKIFSLVLLALGSCLFCSCKSDMSQPGAGDPYAGNSPQNEAEEAYYRDVYSGDWKEQTGPFGFAKSIGKKNGSTSMPPHWNMMPHGAQTMQEIMAQRNASGPANPQVAYNPYSSPAGSGPGMQAAPGMYMPEPAQQGARSPYQSPFDQMTPGTPMASPTAAPYATSNAAALPYQTTAYGAAPNASYSTTAPTAYQPAYQPNPQTAPHTQMDSHTQAAPYQVPYSSNEAPATFTPASYNPANPVNNPVETTAPVPSNPASPYPATSQPAGQPQYQYTPAQEQNPPYATGNAVTFDRVTPNGVLPQGIAMDSNAPVPGTPVLDASVPAANIQPAHTPTTTESGTPAPQENSSFPGSSSNNGNSWMFQPVTDNSALPNSALPNTALPNTQDTPLIIRGQMAPQPDIQTDPSSEAKPANRDSSSEAMVKIASLLASPDSTSAPENAVAASPMDYRRIGGQLLPIEIDPKLADAWKTLKKAESGISESNPCPLCPPCPGVAQSKPDECPGSEYIADGGDAHNTAYATPDWNIHYLEQEDTVAHFDTLDGKILVEPSNRVCIYSPRFGSVRQVIGLAESDQNIVLQMAKRQEVVLTDRSREGVDVRSQEENVRWTKARLQATGLDAKVAGHETSGQQAVMENSLETRIGDMVTLLKTGDLSDADTSFLMAGTTAASAWSELQGVEVKIDNILTSSNVYNQGTETLTFVENGTKTQKLKLVKIASKSAATPGELIEFTLRFENVGEETIGNVTLVDNLSARLTYVDRSAKASVKAEFLAKSNEQGSLILRWEITDPLKPGEFGVVQFLCKVR